VRRVGRERVRKERSRELLVKLRAARARPGHTRVSKLLWHCDPRKLCGGGAGPGRVWGTCERRGMPDVSSRSTATKPSELGISLRLDVSAVDRRAYAKRTVCAPQTVSGVTPVKLRDGEGSPNLAVRAQTVSSDDMVPLCIGLTRFGGLCVPLSFQDLKILNIGSGRDHRKSSEPGIVGKLEVTRA